ncbi:DUF2614 family zinc ribbon-containing protein [Alicyclobacillus contaminans]|uniref:DUF2614 family zinc ribbon-containing protein n=1 Tax=Alicyclobacillus contaminans TaxID=392016 RepID=UPI00040C4A95|nr:DUF2614 family zinc ribbon-containing protein [Alicyclobacillus contaminans]
MNINRWRNWALLLMFGGFFVMYLGVYDKVLLPVLLVIGSLAWVAGIGIYFRFGPVNTRLNEIECPRCGQRIRLTGATDACAHCGLPMRRVEGGQYEPYVPE